ncbi:hypothetical protein FXN63_04350 [Pigmentiphaga aceris]|uniref:Uncharacterized protein n=1 Tax=Pigmentiphaga aceris TaxID=1940612 RepID=A0A5C0AWR8_9BURK|nr:hypothetical protein [Pigmentiphaga aceris]QEI05151.1 hypothetical protein FXN63_04350 [Pigmentiphaga aceris]
MVILFFAALILALPTAGLSIVAYIAVLIARSYFRARGRMHHANEKRAERAVVNGENRLPSWVGQETEQDVFLYAVRSFTLRKGVPADFVDAVLQDKNSFTSLMHLAGAMEVEGSSFMDQQLAVSTKLLQYWDAQKHVYEGARAIQTAQQKAEKREVQEDRQVHGQAEGAQPGGSSGDDRVLDVSRSHTPSPLTAKTRNPMFDAARTKLTATLNKMNINVLLIMQAGQILMTSDSLQQQPADWMGGDVLEVMFKVEGREPYFVYYQNSDYYVEMVRGRANFDEATRHEQYRSEASHALATYLVLQLYDQGIDISHDSLVFSHNRIHTNVLAYVERHDNWYPIQHCNQESDSATEQKVASVNNGQTEITDHIAMRALSPA